MRRLDRPSRPRACRCIRPIEFASRPGECWKCGHGLPGPTITVFTWRLAVALADALINGTYPETIRVRRKRPKRRQ